MWKFKYIRNEDLNYKFKKVFKKTGELRFGSYNRSSKPCISNFHRSKRPRVTPPKKIIYFTKIWLVSVVIISTNNPIKGPIIFWQNPKEKVGEQSNIGVQVEVFAEAGGVELGSGGRRGAISISIFGIAIWDPSEPILKSFLKIE